MRIQITSVKNMIDDELKEQIMTQLHFSLGRYGTRIGRVLIRLDDINGPRGGLDKRCRIDVDLMGRRDDVFIEVVSYEIGEAIDLSIDKAIRAVDRKMKSLISKRSFDGEINRTPFLMKGVLN